MDDAITSSVLPVSPAQLGGRGLKLLYGDTDALASMVSPAQLGGRGLKQKGKRMKSTNY